METNDYKKCIRNAKKTAMRDGYDQLIILDTSESSTIKKYLNTVKKFLKIK
nr:MAG: hypothetical protein [Bacteriophage sp.]